MNAEPVEMINANLTETLRNEIKQKCKSLKKYQK